MKTNNKDSFSNMMERKKSGNSDLVESSSGSSGSSRQSGRSVRSVRSISGASPMTVVRKNKRNTLVQQDVFLSP